MKTLDQYLADNEMDQVELARKLAKRTEKTVEACAVVISRIVKHRHRPSDEVIGHIYVLTNGDVTPNDYFDLPKLPRRKAEGVAVC